MNEHVYEIGSIVYADTHINRILGNTRIGSERKSERSPTRFWSRSIAFSSSCLGRSAFCFPQRAISFVVWFLVERSSTRGGREYGKKARHTSEFALRSAYIHKTSLSCWWCDAFPRCHIFPRGRSRLWFAISAREPPRNNDVRSSIMRRERERDRKHLRWNSN